MQLYMISLTALWVYDYFLTVGEEVAEFTDNNDAGVNLTTLSR